MIRPKRTSLIPSSRFAVFVVLTIALFLVIDYGTRTTAGRAVSQSEQRLRAEIEGLRAEQEALKRRLEYVQTDAYVEGWAREQGMVRPGDHLFVIVQAPESSAEPAQPSASPGPVQEAAAPPPNWYAWWRLFFDTAPGKLTRR